MTQPISRSTIKAIACSKPTISANENRAGAENKYEYSYLEERFLKKHLSSVECSFIEPNIKDIHTDPYLPLVTSSSTKRGSALKSLLLTFTGYIHR